MSQLDSASSPKSSLPEGSLSPIHVTHYPFISPSAHNGMGNMAQKQGHCHPRRGDSPDQSCPDGHSGMVRRGLDRNMEVPLPDYSNQCENEESAAGSSDIGDNTEPMVEISHKCTSDFEDWGARVEQAKAAIGNAPLGRIELVSLGEKSDWF